QGEDVVAGTRTPHAISELGKENPKIDKEFAKIRKILEKHYKDMMDIEFTIQQSRLWMLQCRVGKSTGFAAVKMAVVSVKEKAIDEARLLAKGLNAGPGAASGRIALSAQDAEEMAAQGDPVILVRIETSPEDIKGMNASEGILTARGGMTSHAALVARQMGKV